MKKLKWKKAVVQTVTPFLKHHDVKGYTCGELAVHKLPNSKPTAWSITHVKTGMGIWSAHQAPFRTMVEVKEFARQLLTFDTWYIENAGWGDLPESTDDRVKSLQLVLRTVLHTNGYKEDYRRFSPTDNPKPVYLCKCGKIGDRYMLTISKEKWRHFCLDCEPHDNKRREE